MDHTASQSYCTTWKIWMFWPIQKNVFLRLTRLTGHSVGGKIVTISISGVFTLVAKKISREYIVSD